MIIHMWMHWFWITTFFSKSFLMFTVQMISISCVRNSPMTEAGLLDNDNFENVDLRGEINSSQESQNITSLALVNDTEKIYSSESTSPITFFTSTSYQKNSTEAEIGVTTSRFSEVLFGKTSSEISPNAEESDGQQYPQKKVTKYSSHMKHSKLRGKGKGTEGFRGEDWKSESVKVVEKKISINMSEVDSNRAVVKVDEFPQNESKGVSGFITEPTTMVDYPSFDFNDTKSSNSTFITLTTEVSLKNESLKTEISVFSTTVNNLSEVSSSLAEGEKNFIDNGTLVIESKVEDSEPYTTVESFVAKNRAAAATSAQNYDIDHTVLNAGSITGAVSFVFYRRRYINKPQVLNDKSSNLDSSGYIDDTSLRDNSEEMYSLDNDSFLNSLEAMTIQNYWTENVKHTKL